MAPDFSTRDDRPPQYVPRPLRWPVHSYRLRHQSPPAKLARGSRSDDANNPRRQWFAPRPASTLALRAAAASLSDALGGRDVLAASIAHSDAVPASKLNDIPAQTLNTTIANLTSSYGTIGGNVGAVIQPLYLGPSDGLKNGIEACAAALPNGYSLRIGGCLVDEKAAPSDNRVARALASNVLRVARREKLQPPLKVVVCDHGTPSPEVNAVRNKLAIDVQALLGEERADVAAASMERREGEE